MDLTDRTLYQPSRRVSANIYLCVSVLRAIQNGATTLAESFLFVVGAGLVLGETWRSSRKEGKRRDDVADRLERLEADLGSVKGLLEGDGAWSKALEELREQ